VPDWLITATESDNDQYTKEQITKRQVYSAFISGIKKGAHKEAFEEALRILKFNTDSKNPNLHAHALWLHRNCDRSKLNHRKPLETHTYASHDVSAVRTRGGGKGGGRGGKGGGRGGRGGKGKGKGKGNRTNSDSPPSGQINWRDTYYMVEDAEGKDTVTKPVPESQSSKPCFTFITHGKCTTPRCPFNHEFNIVDLREEHKGQKSSNAETAEEEPEDPNYQSSSANTRSIPEEEEEEFDYAYDMGFKHRSNCVTSNNFNYSKTTSNFSLFNYFSDLSTLFQLLLVQFFTTIFSFSDVLLYMYIYLFDTLLSSPSKIFNIVSTTLYLPTPSEATMGIISVPFTLATEIMRFASNLIDSHSLKIFTVQLQSSVKYFGNLACAPLAFYLFLALTFLLIDGRVLKTFKTPIKMFANGSSVRNAVYKIILDCGCTFTMSGDRGLFIESTLVEINEDVGLAESGYSSRATHRGKILIDNRPIDALLVPDFKQTMVSMGQLERMGLTMTSSGTVRNFVTDKGDIFLSFYIAPNNLYPLLPRSESSSSSATKSKSN
jgi:hypothetical protein